MRTGIPLTALAVAVLTLAGCTAPESPEPGTGGTGATGGEPPEQDVSPDARCGLVGNRNSTQVGSTCNNPASGTVDVAMDDESYEPLRLYVKQGTTLRWTNRDNATHTATADNAAWDTGDVAPGSSAEQTLGNQGSFPYHCKYHGDRGMVAVVHVVA